MSGSEHQDNQQVNAEEVMDQLGMPAEEGEGQSAQSEPSEQTTAPTPESDPLFVQKRLKQQSRQHQREMKEMQMQLAAMQAHLTQGQSQLQQPTGQSNGGIAGDDVIQRAVNAALAQRELQEKQQKSAQEAAILNKKYADFKEYLNKEGDKNDDFHDKVFDEDLPITSNMHAYAMTLPRKGKGSAAEVLYHLAKNRDELTRISKLNPIDQATEMATLSHALISGGENKIAQQAAKNPIGNIKNMPNPGSIAVSEKTPVSSIREQMKAGTWFKKRR